MYVIRWSASVIKVGVAYVVIHISRHLKEELAWGINSVRLLIMLYHQYKRLKYGAYQQSMVLCKSSKSWQF